MYNLPMEFSWILFGIFQEKDFLTSPPFPSKVCVTNCTFQTVCPPYWKPSSYYFYFVWYAYFWWWGGWRVQKFFSRIDPTFCYRIVPFLFFKSQGLSSPIFSFLLWALSSTYYTNSRCMDSKSVRPHYWSLNLLMLMLCAPFIWPLKKTLIISGFFIIPLSGI